jgi:predicted nucleic acid-binding protein
MNRIIAGVNSDAIHKVLNEIFTSEYEKLLQYEYRMLNKDTMSYLVQYYSSKSIHHVEEKGILNKVYSIYNKNTSYTYDNLYDAVIEAIDFENSDITSGKYALEEVIDILRNEKKKINISDIYKATYKVSNNYKSKIYDMEIDYQYNIQMLKMNEWMYK